MTSRFASLSKVLTAFVVLALLAAVFLVFTSGGNSKQLTADFASANSLYKGGEVRVAGVTIGEIKSVEAKGDRVRVTMEIDGDVKVPADAKAVEISPAIVGDRFVQLAPAYTGGAVMPDRGHIGMERTAVPVELDDIFKSVDNLALALGPEGANKDGALSRLIGTTSEQFDGQGQQLADTLENFSKLSTTLSNNQDALFSSITEVNKFVGLMNRNDAEVRKFFDSTAEVSEVLAGERDDLAKTIRVLSKALLEVRNFVRDNRDAIRGNVDNLESIAAVLANHTEDIDHLLTEAPVAFALLGAIGGGTSGTADARTNLGDVLEAYAPTLPTDAATLCTLLGFLGTPCPASAGAGAGPAGTASAGANPLAPVVPTAENPLPGIDKVLENLSGIVGGAN